MDNDHHQNQHLFLLNNIINYNNMGANYLDCGNIKMGIKYLSKALHMSNEVVSLSQDNSSSSQHCNTPNFQIDDWMEGTESSSIDDDEDPEDAVVSGSPHFVYSRPIHIPTCASSKSSSSDSSSSSTDDVTMTTTEEEQKEQGETIEESNYSMVTGAIVFNLALAFLLQGRQYNENTTDPSSRFNGKSLKLFQCALQLAEKTHCSSKVTLFAMAALNNIRFLYNRLGQQDDASNCQQRISKALVSMMMMSSAADNNDAGVRDTTALSKYEGFFRLLIDPTCSSTCAGAA